ncbi:MAG: FAD-dependent oxidoreductase [Betaproteobacteria bacterium]|nr:FAD-dependent oxidoreductase [Betaproteobacteria bacterium]
MTTVAKPRAIIAGGSLGGLLVGNLLHRAGWDVEIYERVAGSLDGRGAGLVTHPEQREIIWQSGVSRDAPLGIWVDRRIVLDRFGSVIGELPLRQLFTGWSRLYHLFHAVFPRSRYHDGIGIVNAEQRSDGVTAVFADGSRRDADLLIAADGVRSTLRAQLAPEVQPEYAGYVAWRGLAEESAFSAATHRSIFEEFAFSLPEREQMIGYPVAGARDDITPGKRRYNFVWYRPAAEATELKRLCTDATGKVHDGAIPPPLIRPEIIAETRAVARVNLSPQFAEVVERTKEPFFQPIYDVRSPRLVFGRVVLLGDSAFVARPHCGMGVAKAAGDARALVDALTASNGGDVTRALHQYEAARVPFGMGVVQHARHLGAYYQAEQRTPEERASAERYRDPFAVIRDTAIPFTL